MKSAQHAWYSIDKMMQSPGTGKRQRGLNYFSHPYPHHPLFLMYLLLVPSDSKCLCSASFRFPVIYPHSSYKVSFSRAAKCFPVCMFQFGCQQKGDCWTFYITKATANLVLNTCMCLIINLSWFIHFQQHLSRRIELS